MNTKLRSPASAYSAESETSQTVFDQSKCGQCIQPRTKDRRREKRTKVSLPVQIYGKDAYGLPFLQSALARDISSNGARIEGIGPAIRSGDVIGLKYKGKTAHFRVVWVLCEEGTQQIVIGIMNLDPTGQIWETAGSE